VVAPHLREGAPQLYADPLYIFFEMITYLLVTPIIFFFCMADTTFALKRSEESGA
jgi:hypothetical protein